MAGHWPRKARRGISRRSRILRSRGVPAGFDPGAFKVGSAASHGVVADATDARHKFEPCDANSGQILGDAPTAQGHRCWFADHCSRPSGGPSQTCRWNFRRLGTASVVRGPTLFQAAGDGQTILVHNLHVAQALFIVPARSRAPRCAVRYSPCVVVHQLGCAVLALLGWCRTGTARVLYWCCVGACGAGGGVSVRFL